MNCILRLIPWFMKNNHRPTTTWKLLKITYIQSMVLDCYLGIWLYLNVNKQHDRLYESEMNQTERDAKQHLCVKNLNLKERITVKFNTNVLCWNKTQQDVLQYANIQTEIELPKRIIITCIFISFVMRLKNATWYNIEIDITCCFKLIVVILAIIARQQKCQDIVLKMNARWLL